MRPSARRDAQRGERSEVTAYLTAAQYAWVNELAQAMSGLNCTMSDVIRLALDDLRNRHPSTKKLEAALREHVWREREGNVGQPPLPGVRLHALPPAGGGAEPCRWNFCTVARSVRTNLK